MICKKRFSWCLSVAVLGLILTSQLGGQDRTTKRPPIIDVHLHALAADFFGTPPAAGCRDSRFPGWDPLKPIKVDECSAPFLSAKTDDDLMKRTLAMMTRYNVVKAIASGSRIEAWKAAAPDRIIAGLVVGSIFGTGFETGSAQSLSLLAGKRYEVIAEFAPQYDGINPADPRLEPYYALAEELDIVVGIHIGPAAPGQSYIGAPKYRMGLSNPLLLEDVLVKHPKLRVYVSHAGWPMLDQMIGLLYAHPQVYVDTGVIDWYLPTSEFYSYLRRLVQAGFAKRIMFGSDQMVFPEAVGWGVEAIESATFLTPEQKRDILYNNAVRFLRLDTSQHKSVK